VKSDKRLMLLLSTAAFLFCSAVAGAGLFRPLDVWLLGLAQGYTSGVMDVVGIVASLVGGVEFVAVAAIALAAGLFFQGRSRLAFRLLAAFVLTGLIEVAFKTFVPQAPVPEDATRGPDLRCWTSAHRTHTPAATCCAQSSFSEQSTYSGRTGQAGSRSLRSSSPPP
jgi:hypothetical protein